MVAAILPTSTPDVPPFRGFASHDFRGRCCGRPLDGGSLATTGRSAGADPNRSCPGLGSALRQLSYDRASLEQQLGDLDRVESSALAKVVAGEKQD